VCRLCSLQGYHFAAAQQVSGVDKCRCGNSFEANGTPSVQCNKQCKDDKREWCGGEHELLIAHTGQCLASISLGVCRVHDIGTRTHQEMRLRT